MIIWMDENGLNKYRYYRSIMNELWLGCGWMNKCMDMDGDM